MSATVSAAGSRRTPLFFWLRFQLCIDLTAGLLLLTLPLAVLAKIPVPVVPIGAGATAVRMLGLYPMGLAIAFYAATVDGVNARAAWIANAFRLAGGFALFAGAALDPAAPALLRTMFAGEWIFVAITAFLMAREGHTWWKPA